MSFEDQRPLARTARVLEREVDDEVVIYDLETDEAHLLNSTTRWVWRRCDGTTTVQVLISELADMHGPEAADAMAWQAIDELVRADLLESSIDIPVSGMSRRALLRKIGIGVLAIPVISTIAASPAAAAATAAACSTGTCLSVSPCRVDGGTCGSGTSTGCSCSVTASVCACRP